MRPSRSPMEKSFQFKGERLSSIFKLVLSDGVFAIPVALENRRQLGAQRRHVIAAIVHRVLRHESDAGRVDEVIARPVRCADVSDLVCEQNDFFNRICRCARLYNSPVTIYLLWLTRPNGIFFCSSVAGTMKRFCWREIVSRITAAERCPRRLTTWISTPL